MRDHQSHILNQKEISQIYDLPKLTAKQRAVFLELTIAEEKILNTYRTILLKVYFILQLAYFKCKHQFFVFDLSQVKSDVNYLQKNYYLNEKLPLSGAPSKPLRLKQQKIILDLLGYQPSNSITRKILFERACHLAKLSANPVFIIRDLINWSKQKKIVIPAYSTMQRFIIGQAIYKERERLEDIINSLLNDDFKTCLDNFLNKKSGKWYILTWLSQEMPNFNSKSIRQETKKKIFISPLYPTTKKLIEKFNISNENIRYYASLSEHYTVGELRQFKNGIVYVFLLCYIHYRYQKINDVLVEAFKYYVRKYESNAKKTVNDYFSKYYLEANKQLSKVPKILELFTDNKINDNTPFSVIKDRVFDVLDKEKMLLLTEFINKNHVDEMAVRQK